MNLLLQRPVIDIYTGGINIKRRGSRKETANINISNGPIREGLLWVISSVEVPNHLFPSTQVFTGIVIID